MVQTRPKPILLTGQVSINTYEPYHEKTRFSYMRKQRQAIAQLSSAFNFATSQHAPLLPKSEISSL